MRIVNFYFIQILLKYRLFSFIFEISLRYFYEKNQPQFTQRTWHENFIHFVRIILYETVSTYWKWNFTWGWRAPGELHSALCFYGNFYFFSPGWSASRGKNWRTQKSTFVWTSGKSTTDCADRFSRKAHNRSISQSVSLPNDAQLLAWRFPKIVPSLVFVPRGSL